MKKPKVITKGVASHYELPNEKIVEYSFGTSGVGGLIQFTEINGECRVVLYNHDKEIKIVVVRNG